MGKIPLKLGIYVIEYALKRHFPPYPDNFQQIFMLRLYDDGAYRYLSGCAVWLGPRFDLIPSLIIGGLHDHSR